MKIPPPQRPEYLKSKHTYKGEGEGDGREK
jgi:hypothetical protein